MIATFLLLLLWIGEALATYVTVDVCGTYNADYDDVSTVITELDDDYFRNNDPRPARGAKITAQMTTTPFLTYTARLADENVTCANGQPCACGELVLDDTLTYNLKLYADVQIAGNAFEVVDDDTTPAVWYHQGSTAWTPVAGEKHLTTGEHKAWRIAAAAGWALHRRTTVGCSSWMTFYTQACPNQDVSCVYRFGEIYINADHDDYKYVVVHELGHQISMCENENTFGANKGPQNTVFDGACQDAGRMVAKQHAGEAAVEGIAWYYAAVAFNDTFGSDCEFSKSADYNLNDVMGELAFQEQSASCEGGTANTWAGLDYIDNMCGETVEDIGTQYDYLRAFWDAEQGQGLTTAEVFQIYADANPQSWDANGGGFGSGDDVQERLEAAATGLGLGTEWKQRRRRERDPLMGLLWIVLGCGADPTRDADGDGFPASEDCDDRDAGVHPGAEDAPDDGLDGDCDGYDLGSEPLRGFERIEPDVTTAHLQLGFDFELGDVDGDGVDDVLAGSQEVHATSDGDYYLQSGEAWWFAGATFEPMARWTGARGPQLLGQFVEIVRGDEGDVQFALRALEGIWLVEPSRESGYPGDVGGVLVGSDEDGYVVGNRVKSVDLVDSPDQDVAIECGRQDDSNPWLAAVCIHAGPVTDSVPVGEASVILEGTGHVGAAFADLDFDGDGARDLGVGDDVTGDAAGQVSVVRGPVAPGRYGMEIAEQHWDGESAGDWLGAALFPGDLDGDGQDELLAGAMAWPSGDRRGRLYALTPEVTDVADATLIVDGDPGVQYLGVGAAVADLDGDGAADLAVGSPGLAAIDPTVRGRVLVFYGPLSGHLSSSDAGRVFSGASPGDQAGWTVRAGEVTGDGVVDLVVAAPRASGVQPEMGQLYVLLGPLLP